MDDYYARLDVAPGANRDTVKAAYLAKAIKCHPDHGGSHCEMQLVNAAWHILSDHNRRVQYDEVRRQATNTVATTSDVQSATPCSCSAKAGPRASHSSSENMFKTEEQPHTDYSSWMVGIAVALSSIVFVVRAVQTLDLAAYWPALRVAIWGIAAVLSLTALLEAWQRSKRG